CFRVVMRACRRLCSASRALLQAIELQSGSRFARAAPGLRASAPCSSRAFSAAPSEKRSVPTESHLPARGTLMRVDWMLEHLLPGLMTKLVAPFMEMLVPDVQFEDKLYGYKLSSSEDLQTHIAKIRMYFRYKSPFNKVEYVGSCVYEGEDVVVLLWRLSYLESSLFPLAALLPTFLTRKEPKIVTMEGALDMHVTKEGKVYKIVNRKVTASDLEGAKVMAALKKEQGDQKLAEEEREWRKQMMKDFEEDRLRRM
ncbi:hypothetical protein PMAYCL1PPCAC_00070, partial [Pristionchus mayeri]